MLSPTVIAILSAALISYLICTISIIRLVRRNRATKVAPARRVIDSMQPHEGFEQGTKVLRVHPGNWWVEIHDGSTGRTVPLPRDRVVIGSHPASDIPVRDDFVSSQHTCIRVLEENQIQITDLDSTNGTLLNGKRIERAHIQSGDTIRIGRTEIRLVNLDGAASGSSYPLAS